jgi:hypothetical protein
MYVRGPRPLTPQETPSTTQSPPSIQLPVPHKRGDADCRQYLGYAGEEISIASAVTAAPGGHCGSSFCTSRCFIRGGSCQGHHPAPSGCSLTALLWLEPSSSSVGYMDVGPGLPAQVNTIN